MRIMNPGSSYTPPGDPAQGAPPPAPAQDVGQRPVRARSMASRPAAPAALPAPAGSRTQQGQNPYNGTMPMYNGIDDQDIAWANDTQRKRPDGSWAYKASERNYAQRQILDKQRTQDRELSDPYSETSLRARMGGMADKFGGMMDTAAEQMGQYGAAYDTLDGETGGRISRLDSWNPDMQDGFDTSFLRDQRPDAQKAWTPGKLGSFDSTETRGFNPNALRGVNTQGLRGYNAGNVMRDYLGAGGGGPDYSYDTAVAAGTSTYDPRAAVEEYARGAAMAAQPVLADELEAQANAAARSGRLNTGLFDKDKGSVIRRVGENLNAGILQKSVDAANIRAGIENTNSRNITDANVASARERGNLGRMRLDERGFRSAEARDAARLGLDALDSATGYDVDIADSIDKLLLEKAGTIDKNALSAADATARLTLDQAQGIDTFNQKGAMAYGDLELKRRSGIDDSRYAARRDATDASIKRQGMGMDRLDLANRLWETAGGMTGDAISGERDRITGQRNYDAEMKQREKERKTNFWGGLVTGGARVAAASAGG